MATEFNFATEENHLEMNLKDYSQKDLLDIPSTTIGSAGFFDGADSRWGSSSERIYSHSISSSGMVTFFEDNAGTAQVTTWTTPKIAAAVDYLQNATSLAVGSTVAFTDNTNTYVFNKGSTITASTFIELTSVTGVNGIESTTLNNDYIHIT